MTNMETKKTAKLTLMEGARGIQLEVGKYTLSLAMGYSSYCSNRNFGKNYADELEDPSATSVEVAIFDAKYNYLLPQQVAGWVEVSDLPSLIQALAVDDLPWAIRICGQSPEPKLFPCGNCGSLWPSKGNACSDCTGH